MGSAIDQEDRFMTLSITDLHSHYVGPHWNLSADHHATVTKRGRRKPILTPRQGWSPRGAASNPRPGRTFSKEAPAARRLPARRREKVAGCRSGFGRTGSNLWTILRAS